MKKWSYAPNNVNSLLSDAAGTPLMYAFEKGNMPMIKYLMKNNANILYVTPAGRNCLHFAVKSNNANVVTYARKYLPASSVDSIFKNLRTYAENPLSIAISNGYLNSVKALLPVVNKKMAPMLIWMLMKFRQ